MSKKLPEIYYIEHFTKIPKVFHSAVNDELFANCTMCGKELLESNESYIIEKAVKNYQENKVKDIIFEYAMCFSCLEKMREGFSEESLERINNYILKKTDLPLRRNELIEKGTLDVNDWISKCIVKDINQDQLPEYQIMCQCQGEHMLYTYMPYMLSCNAAEEMQELLSKKTKDELDRFYKDNLGLPPDLEELFRTRMPVI